MTEGTQEKRVYPEGRPSLTERATLMRNCLQLAKACWQNVLEEEVVQATLHATASTLFIQACRDNTRPTLEQIEHFLQQVRGEDMRLETADQADENALAGQDPEEDLPF